MSRSQFHPDNYMLPVANSSVPPEWLSNSDPKPVASSLTTSVISSMSSDQTASGRTEIQIPLGQSAGILSQGYIKMKISLTGTGADEVRFKGANHLATSIINRYTFSVNGVPLDTIQNFDFVMSGAIISHSSSSDWLRNDAVELLYANRVITLAGDGTASVVVCIPLVGVMANSFPAYLCNGSASISLDYNTASRAFVAPHAVAFTVSNVQLIIDKVNPEQQFIDSVRAEIAQGRKFVIPYTSIQSTSLVAVSGSNNLNMGVNVSSMRGVVMNQIPTADLTTQANNGYSVSNSLLQFQVSCDGRLISNVLYDAVAQPSVCFAESQKAFSRLFDASVSDPIGYYTEALGVPSNTSNYTTKNFFVAVSGQRCASNLQFTGTPVSVLGIQWTCGANHTAFFTVLSDSQCLIDSAGNVERVL